MKRLPSWLRRWEWLLAILIILVYAVFSRLLPGIYTVEKLLNQTRVYMVDVGFMSLGMLLVLILGDIDISVASTAALSSTVMSVLYGAGDGAPFPLALGAMLLTGVLCGAANGFLVTRFTELFPMIITLATKTLYSGIAYIILKDQAAGGFPSWFSKGLGYSSVSILGLQVPMMLLFILGILPLFHVVLQHSTAGRRLYATGTNLKASRYSGVRTDRVKMTVFTLNGLLAAVGGVFLCARTGSVKYTIASGFEMQAIAIAVLGGASTSGGRGSVVGVLLALLLMTSLKNGLMLIYNDAFILNLAIGLLLIAVVLLPNIASGFRRRRTLLRQRLDVTTVPDRDASL